MLESAQSSASNRVRELRTGFDSTFAVPPPPSKTSETALLLLRAGGELLAVERAEMTGFAFVEAIARVPARRSPAFTGLAMVRGEIFPVWNLARLLDRPAKSLDSAHWLVLAGSSETACAFACEDFEKLVLVPAESLLPAPPDSGQAAAPFKSAVKWNSSLVPIINLSALTGRISSIK